MHRAIKKFKHSVLNIVSTISMACESMTFYIFHPNTNLSRVYVAVCCLFMLLLLYAQLHGWLYCIASKQQCLISILVWGR